LTSSVSGFFEHLTMIVINLVTPKAAAKQELLFNKPASYLVAQQSMTKIIT
jgi:hypothetical protein